MDISKRNKKSVVQYDDIFRMSNKINNMNKTYKDNDNNILKIKYSNLIKKQNKFYNENISNKLFNKITDTKLIKNLNTIKDKLHKTNSNYYRNYNFDFKLFSLINIIFIFLIMMITVIFLQTTKQRYVLTLFKTKTNFNNFLCLAILFVLFYYIFFKSIKVKKFIIIINILVYTLIIIFLSIFAINYYFYFNNFINYFFLIIIIFWLIIINVSTLFFIFNIFHIKMFGEIYGEILFIIFIWLLFIFYFLFIFEFLFKSNIIVITILGFYLANYIFKISYKLMFFCKNFYLNLIENLKLKIDSHFFKFNFETNWKNEFFHSILDLTNFFLILINFWSLLIYSLNKFNWFWINIENKLLFLGDELNIYLLNLIMFIILLFVWFWNKLLKNKDILFLIIKLFLIFFFIIVFNSHIIFQNNLDFIINLWDSLELKINFYKFIVVISFLPIFNIKYINLVNSLNFGLIFNYTINLIYFLITKSFISYSFLIVLIIIGYFPLFIIIINYLIKHFKFGKLFKNKYFKNRLIILLLSYIYDIILIYTITVYISNLSNSKLNNLNLISFIYCLKIYILMFISNLLKFNCNFDIKKENFISNILNSNKKSDIIFINIIVIFFIAYVALMIIFNLIIDFEFSNYIISFYTFYIYFIWIMYKFYLKNLKTQYKNYLYIYNLAILILFVIPFCLLVSVLYNIYIENNFDILNTNNIINFFLFLIILSFSLWSVIISLIVNIIFSKIVYENMAQYVTLNLKLDCYSHYISCDLNTLRELIDQYSQYNDDDKFIKVIQDGELIIWWDIKNKKNIKKKLILKEHLNIYLKVLEENYKTKTIWFEKLLCIKKFVPEKEIEVEINNDVNNNIDNKNVYNNLVKKFKEEKEENFIKDEYEEIKIKKVNYKLFGNLISNIINKINIKKEEDKTKKLYKEIYYCINNYIKNNEIDNEFIKRSNNIKNEILKIKVEIENIDLNLENEYNLKRKNIIQNNENKIKELLDLYNNKDKLFESLKKSEETRNFFLYLIYEAYSINNNNYSIIEDENDNSLNYFSFIKYLKRIKFNKYFITSYKINIFEKHFKLINLFFKYCDIKREDIDNEKFEKLKKLKNIDEKDINLVGISFKNFLLFIKNFANILFNNIDDINVSTYKFLILKIYSLSKFWLSDFETIIKNIDLVKFQKELENKKLKEERKKTKKILTKLNLEKIAKGSINELEKNKFYKKIEDLKNDLNNYKIEKDKKINENNNILNNQKINLTKINFNKIIENENKYKYEDIMQFKIIRNLIIKKKKKDEEEESIEEEIKESKVEEIEDNISIIKNKNKKYNINDLNTKSELTDIVEKNNNLKSNSNKLSKNSFNKEKYYKSCFCIKTKYNPKKNMHSKKLNLISKIKNFIFNIFIRLGLKDPDNILNEENLKIKQKEPKNWKKFSKFLVHKLKYHKKNYKKIIYNSSILLNTTNILFIFSSVVKIYQNYNILFDSTFPWFKDLDSEFNENESNLFFNNFEFKFGISFGYSLIYFFIGLYAYNSIQKGTLGLDPKTGKKAKFPHIQFIVSIYLAIGESLIFYCVKNLTSLFTCNKFNSELNSFVTNVSDSNICLSNEHFIYLYLSFFGLIGFYFFALIFLPNFQYKEKLLDIKFKPYYIIFDLFFEGLLIQLENILDKGFKTLNVILIISILTLVINFIKILILFLFKPCIIKGFNLFEICVIIFESLPWICNFILIFSRNSYLSISILIGLIFFYLIFIFIYIFKKLKNKKITNNDLNRIVTTS